MERLIPIILCLVLCGCASISENWKIVDGELICVQKMVLKGIGDREAKFEDESEVSAKSPEWLPDIEIEEFRN